METIDSKGVAKFEPRGIIVTIHNGTTKHCNIHRSSGPSGSEKKIFFSFPILSLWELSVAMKTKFLIQMNLHQNLMQSIPQANDGSAHYLKHSALKLWTDVDDRRRMPTYPIRSPVSLRLRYAQTVYLKRKTTTTTKFLYMILHLTILSTEHHPVSQTSF